MRVIWTRATPHPKAHRNASRVLVGLTQVGVRFPYPATLHVPLAPAGTRAMVAPPALSAQQERMRLEARALARNATPTTVSRRRGLRRAVLVEPGRSRPGEAPTGRIVPRAPSVPRATRVSVLMRKASARPASTRLQVQACARTAAPTRCIAPRNRVRARHAKSDRSPRAAVEVHGGRPEPHAQRAQPGVNVMVLTP